jgi:hypothetical protein
VRFWFIPGVNKRCYYREKKNEVNVFNLLKCAAIVCVRTTMSVGESRLEPGGV